jgi:hypothetical protein
MATASSKLAFPLQPHMPTIVLPDFARSCSADGKEKLKPQTINTLKIRHWLVRVAQAKPRH